MSRFFVTIFDVVVDRYIKCLRFVSSTSSLEPHYLTAKFAKMAEIIPIGNLLKVEVGIRFGKYIKFYRCEKSISLAARTWQFVLNNQELISKSLEDGSDYGLTFTQAKSLRVSMFRGQPYVTFCEDFTGKDGIRLTKYVSLNKLEYSTLQNNMEKIKRILDFDVAYCNSADNWQLQRAGQVLDTMKMRLMPRMCAKTFELQLRVYLITSMINKTRKNTCEGCTRMLDLPYWHQSDGYGCQADWYTTVHARIEDAQQAIDLEQAIATINLMMGWEMPIKNFPVDDKILREVTVSHKAMPSCESCKELLPIYWDMFEQILQ